MSKSNRQLRLKLWQFNKHCHWCGKETQLLNIPKIKGRAPDDLATIDHLRSRYSLSRHVKPKAGEITKVLSCFKCNFERGQKETKSLSKEELKRRSKGFSLNPKGNPIITEGLSSIEEVRKLMKEKLPDFDWYENQNKI